MIIIWLLSSMFRQIHATSHHALHFCIICEYYNLHSNSYIWCIHNRLALSSLQLFFSIQSQFTAMNWIWETITVGKVEKNKVIFDKNRLAVTIRSASRIQSMLVRLGFFIRFKIGPQRHSHIKFTVFFLEFLSPFWARSDRPLRW